MSKDQWIAEHERCLEDFADNGDREAAEQELARLGFDPHEIAEQLDAVEAEQ